MKKIIISKITPGELMNLINSVKLIGEMYVEVNSVYDAVDKSKLKSFMNKGLANIAVSNSKVPTKPIKTMDENDIKILVDKRVEELLSDIVLWSAKDEPKVPNTNSGVIDYYRKSLDLVKNSHVDWNNPFYVVRLCYSFLGSVSELYYSKSGKYNKDDETLYHVVKQSVSETDNMTENMNEVIYNVVSKIKSPEMWLELANNYLMNSEISDHLGYYIANDYEGLIVKIFSHD